MKKITSILLAVAMMLAMIPAFAETADTTALEQRIAELEAQLADYETLIAELNAKIEAYEAEPEVVFEVLQKGSKGERVVELQKRLQELKYLSGSADGDFGNGTKSAVASFQATAGLTDDGVVTEETWNALFAEDAPKSKEYMSLSYKEISRNPSHHEGDLVQFSGKIVQVMEDDGVAAFRIATKGNYDDVVYCIYFLPDDYSRFLEDDRVNVWAVCTGVYTYTTVRGNELTIPSFLIERIELK